jgi:tRNA-binding protein
MEQISYNEFAKIQLYIGTVLTVSQNDKIRNPSYVLEIDFGALGVRTSSAQITSLYHAEDLIGRQVVAVLNFPAKQIANIKSECLVLGCVQEDSSVVLLQPERIVPNGTRVS